MFWLFLEFLHSSRYQPLYYLTVIIYILDVLVILGIFTLLSLPTFVLSNSYSLHFRCSGYSWNFYTPLVTNLCII